MFVGNALLNLGVLSLNPGVIFITMGMQLGQSLETLFSAAMVDEPTRGLSMIREGKSSDQGGECLPRGRS